MLWYIFILVLRVPSAAEASAAHALAVCSKRFGRMSSCTLIGKNIINFYKHKRCFFLDCVVFLEGFFLVISLSCQGFVTFLWCAFFSVVFICLFSVKLWDSFAVLPLFWEFFLAM